MPSWNIHIAHATALIDDMGMDALGISQRDAFLFGHVLPDVYVGYLLPDARPLRDYRDTHWTHDAHIPLPSYQGFYKAYITDYRAADDMVKGAWLHLMCDHVYNKATREVLMARGLQPSDALRECKQADFAAFGATLTRHICPEKTPELLAQAYRFPQYPLDEDVVDGALVLIEDFARQRYTEAVRPAGYTSDGYQPERIQHSLEYSLLDDAFFARTFARAHELMKTSCEAVQRLHV